MASIDDGMQIDRSEGQKKNADSPRLEILPPGSNVRQESSWQQQKQPLGILSIDDGMQIA
jgi:hypothetical protein